MGGLEAKRQPRGVQKTKKTPVIGIPGRSTGYPQSLERGTRSKRALKLALSEHEIHWRGFLQSLVSRGVCGMRLVINDAHEGLISLTAERAGKAYLTFTP